MAGGALAVLGLTYLQFLEYTPLELFDAIEVKSELHDADQKYQALLMRIQTWYLYSIHVAEKDRYKIADIEKFMPLDFDDKKPEEAIEEAEDFDWAKYDNLPIGKIK